MGHRHLLMLLGLVLIATGIVERGWMVHVGPATKTRDRSRTVSHLPLLPEPDIAPRPNHSFCISGQ